MVEDIHYESKRFSFHLFDTELSLEKVYIGIVDYSQDHKYIKWVY